ITSGDTQGDKLGQSEEKLAKYPGLGCYLGDFLGYNKGGAVSPIRLSEPSEPHQRAMRFQAPGPGTSGARPRRCDRDHSLAKGAAGAALVLASSVITASTAVTAANSL